MAHFAELNSDNIVLRVVVIDNNDVNNNGGDQSEQAAKYVEKISPLIGGVKYVQTSIHSNFRRSFAGIGGKYIPEKDIFIGSQPYPSWSFDSDYYWQPPVVRPTDGSNGSLDQRYKDTSITSFKNEYGEVIQIPNGLPAAIYWTEEIVSWTCIDEKDVMRKWIPSNQSWEIVPRTYDPIKKDWIIDK
jgi:hypothetical protein